MLDVKKARLETPGCERVIHFNNAGAALMPAIVRDTLVEHVDRELMMGGYEAADLLSTEHERIYQSVSYLLGCEVAEVALLESATQAWINAFYAIPFEAGDIILTGRAEYAANYIAFLQVARRSDVRVKVIPVDEHGQISLAALSRMIERRVKLIAITHIPTNGGLINPAKAIGQIARENGVLYLLDACQSVGQMPIDVQDLGCDFLSGTSRKYLRGPRGVGFLFARRDHLPAMEPITLDLFSAEWISADHYVVRSDARRFEKWEYSLANRLAFGAAVDYALEWGIENIWKRIQHLADNLRNRLGDVPGCTVRDLGQEQCGIVSFTVDGIAHRQVKALLAAQNINVSISDRASSLLDMEARGLDDVVRASVHYYNTDEEIARFCETLRLILHSRL